MFYIGRGAFYGARQLQAVTTSTARAPGHGLAQTCRLECITVSSQPRGELATRSQPHARATELADRCDWGTSGRWVAENASDADPAVMDVSDMRKQANSVFVCLSRSVESSSRNDVGGISCYASGNEYR